MGLTKPRRIGSSTCIRKIVNSIMERTLAMPLLEINQVRRLAAPSGSMRRPLRKLDQYAAFLSAPADESPETTPARWLPIHLHALSSSHRWRDLARQCRSVETIAFFLSSRKATSRFHDYGRSGASV